MTLRHFLRLSDLDDEALARVLRRAGELERQPRSDALAGRVLGLLFLNPSLRTLTSFQAGMAQLGGSSVVLTPGQGTWGLETRAGVVMDGAAAEHVNEAVPVLESYVDALGVRCFGAGASLEEDLGEPVLSAMAGASSGPLVNLESAVDHPCQALADFKTLDDAGVPAQGGRLALRWCRHPKALPVAVPTAVLRMAARRGMEVTVVAPEPYQLPESLVPEGLALRRSTDPVAGLEDAHVVYAKAWRRPDYSEDAGGPLDWPAEPSHPWRLDAADLEALAPEVGVMHCLPVRRNVVLADDVLDGPRSWVLRQAANRLHVQKAILLELLGG